jgi:hypothetical protein
MLIDRVQSRPQADEVVERVRLPHHRLIDANEKLHGRWIHPMTGQALEIRIADSEVSLRLPL